jgi:uncharacterized protein
MGRAGRVRWLRWTAVIGVALVLAYGGACWILSDKLIGQQFTALGPVEFPKFGLPDPENVTIAGDGVELAGWYFENPRRERCAVVMLHGFGGARAEVLAASPLFWDRGCDLLMYDARGHGESSRALLTYGFHERNDLLSAIAWLGKRADLPRTRIGLIGWSYGAATAIQAAAEASDLAFVVADSSFSSLADITRVQGERQFGSWTRIFIPGTLFVSSLRAGFDAREASPLQAISRVKSPVLLVHSRQDGFTPVEHSQRIYEHSNKTRTTLVIPSWEATHAHSYTVNPVGYTTAVDSFLSRFAAGFGIRHQPT